MPMALERRGCLEMGGMDRKDADRSERGGHSGAHVGLLIPEILILPPAH